MTISKDVTDRMWTPSNDEAVFYEEQLTHKVRELRQRANATEIPAKELATMDMNAELRAVRAKYAEIKRRLKKA